MVHNNHKTTHGNVEYRVTTHGSVEYRSVYDNIEVVGDGDTLCARFDDFEDLMESPAGFGDTDAEAIADLARNLRDDIKALQDSV
ncbi:MAG: hypothetical protein U9Q17_01410 [Chloroflexota bacterium]|nr:hypothetical protein [Chloroflexota bacterium]